MKRKTIRLEIDEVTVVRRRKRTAYVTCENCDDDVQMVTLEEAAVVVDSSKLEICRLVGDGNLHIKENNGQVLLICLNSLIDVLNRVKSDS
jgi:hypothetical protein